MTRERKIARAPGPRWLRGLLTAVAGAYLVTIAVRSAGCSTPDRVLPRLPLFFTQIACLFPGAAKTTVEYRLGGYSCERRQYLEVDYRPYFPIRADDKENRFQRVAHFYSGRTFRQQGAVMRDLEEFVVTEHNARASLPGGAEDGLEGPIGGIYLLVITTPVPEPGAPIERHQFRPSAQFPVKQREIFYRTKVSQADARCDAGATP